jgi:hypothetical protein
MEIDPVATASGSVPAEIVDFGPEGFLMESDPIATASGSVPDRFRNKSFAIASKDQNACLVG